MIGGTPVLLFARLSILLSDGDGLRMAFGWKGAGGLRACLRHCNVLKKGSDLAGRVTGHCEITCDDPSVFQCTTTQQFHDALDLVAAAHARLEAGTMTKTLFGQVSMSQGFNYVPGGLAYDMALRANGVDVFQAIRKDWMHSALQDGMLTVECHLYIKACDAAIGKGYEDVERFFRPVSYTHLTLPTKRIV